MAEHFHIWRKTTYLYFWILVILSIKGRTVTLSTQNRALGLYERLFHNEYQAAIIPLCSDVDKVKVRVDMALRELVELHEKHQLIRLKIWMRLKWNDCTLRWNSTEFNGIESITMPYGNVWIPDITLYEGSSDEANMPGKDEYYARVDSDGTVTYNFPSIITASCQIDVTFFPYDRQNCSLTFGSWIHDGNLIDLELVNPYADTEKFVHHNEWNLEFVPAFKHVLYYNCCPEPYPDVTYYVSLSRFPKFYLLTVFVPCVIISILSILGFVLPPVSGDKISLQITVLLSIVVFLLLVQDKLPSSSDTFPHLGVFFMTAMCLTSLSCVMSGIIMYIYYRDITGRKIPVCIRVFFLKYMRRILCVKLKPGSGSMYEMENDVIVKNIQTLDGKQLQNGDCTKLHRGRHSIKRESVVITSKHDIPSFHEPEAESGPKHAGNSIKHYVTNEWELLAYVLDRLFMIVYILLTSINVFSYLFIMRNELHRF
ncbi:hypothetical protein FSP39_012316 [Pinctada imbricata]|uniref:Uncharacterized protein n=1 Tax=Pinctada imbricata TaxID=66713 RepID=A0AA88YHA9_PINIB|nr:hypothetical protein FSP39_012316 [Pinctada imbricata]